MKATSAPSALMAGTMWTALENWSVSALEK
jgi:hypothetical protein